MEFSQKLLEEDEDIDSSDTDSSTTIEENDPEPTYFSLDEEIDTSLFTPLYEDAPLSVAASLQAIMGFSLGNHLSYSAMDQLLDLLKLHVPSTCGLPKSLNRLKRQFFIDEPQQFKSDHKQPSHKQPNLPKDPTMRHICNNSWLNWFVYFIRSGNFLFNVS